MLIIKYWVTKYIKVLFYELREKRKVPSKHSIYGENSSNGIEKCHVTDAY